MKNISYVLFIIMIGFGIFFSSVSFAQFNLCPEGTASGCTTGEPYIQDNTVPYQNTGNCGISGGSGYQCYWCRTVMECTATTCNSGSPNCTITRTDSCTPIEQCYYQQATPPGCQSDSDCPQPPDTTCAHQCVPYYVNGGQYGNACQQVDPLCGVSSTPGNSCGDGICNYGETSNTCPNDCPVTSTAPSFGISVSPTTSSSLNGETKYFYITITPYNTVARGSYTLQNPIAGCPTGATCTYNGGNTTSTSEDVSYTTGETIIVPAYKTVIVSPTSVAQGTYTLTFCATKDGTSVTECTSTYLTVNTELPVVNMKGWGGSVSQSSPTDGPIYLQPTEMGGLVWSASNVTSCQIYRDSTNLGTYPANGSAGVGPIGTTAQTHTFTCTGPGGTRSDSVSHLPASSNFPNLTASTVGQNTAIAGTALSFTATITNTGTTGTGSSFSNFFQVATASDGGGTITDLTATTMSALASSGTGTATSPSYTFPSAGTYSVRACADKSNSASAGTITESNESDNCGNWTTVTVSSVATACPSGSPFIASKTLGGTLRNNHEGWVGTKITIGSTAQTVHALGRIKVAGNSSSHVVKIVGSNSVDIPNGSVSINMSSGTNNEYIYATLATPVTLSANTSYYIASREVSGGDQWYDTNGTVVTPSSVGTIPTSAYAGVTGAYTDTGQTNRSYVPVDLCVSTAPTPISITSFNPYFASITNYPTTNNNTVYWTTSGNPTSCVASGASPWGDGSGTTAVNSSIASGSHYQGVYPSTGTYTYTLTCSKAGVADATASFSVPVSTGVTYTLTTIKPIGGTITTTDGQISCGTTCTKQYNQGSSVVLQAVPSTSYWRFVGWGGACSGQGTGNCTLNITSNTTVTAQFRPKSLLYQEF